jgi:large subunit ribosomal protein L13
LKASFKPYYLNIVSQRILNATKTTRPTKNGLNRDWFILDASKEPLGRIATKAADYLTGKYRADYAPDVDMGAMVVVINSAQTVVTGMKAKKKNYFTHSGRIGGLKIISFEDLIVKDPTSPIYKAISGMLPKNKHRDLRLNNHLFIFKGDHNITQKMVAAN